MFLVAGCRFGFELTPDTDAGGDGPGVRVRRLRIGAAQTCELRDSGELYCWGNNSGGQLGTGAMTGAVTMPIRAGGAMLWKDIALGSSHGCGLDQQGHAWCWGSNVNGQLGLATPACGNTNVDAGEDCDDGNTANGDACSAICTTAAPPVELAPRQLPDGRVYRAIFAEAFSTWAIAEDGTLWSWGRNGARQLATGDNGDRGKPTPSPIVAPQVGADNDWQFIGGGNDHTCAVQGVGSLWCWGSNGNGQLGQGSSTMIVRERPEIVAAGTTWADVGGGGDYSCALDRAGVVHCWGRNDEAQLGIGDVMDRDVPVAVEGTGYERVASGFAHSCALRGDGSVWCWGRNTLGETGNGTMSATQPTPSRVDGAWRDLASGADFSCAIASDDSIWCWGDGTAGRLGNGGTVTSNVPVRVLFP